MSSAATRHPSRERAVLCDADARVVTCERLERGDRTNRRRVRRLLGAHDAAVTFVAFEHRRTAERVGVVNERVIADHRPLAVGIVHESRHRRVKWHLELLAHEARPLQGCCAHDVGVTCGGVDRRRERGMTVLVECRFESGEILVAPFDERIGSGALEGEHLVRFEALVVELIKGSLEATRGDRE